jgi:diadenosine tetraphosphate (Ap4A) HIT family hydrolase
MKYDTLEKAASAGVAPWDLKVEELSDFHVAVFRDRFPVATGHLLFVPMYNNGNMIKDCFSSAYYHGQKMVEEGKWEAFNIGFNCGQAAGQTVMYPHIHLIPRKTGDCSDPVGGVRSVIFGQANYKSGGYQLPK